MLHKLYKKISAGMAVYVLPELCEMKANKPNPFINIPHLMSHTEYL